MTELRIAFRRLLRHPVRGVAVAVTLAVGIGPATAAFTAFDSVVLRDLPVRDQDGLVVVWQLIPERGSLPIPFRAPSYQAVAEGAGSLEAAAGISAWGAQPVPVGQGTDVTTLNQARTAGDFFGVLGVRPSLGRLTHLPDDQPGATPVTVLSHAAWRNRFGSDSEIVGRTLGIDGEEVTVIGVAPPAFDFPLGTDLWTPLRHDVAGDRGFVELHVVGRMADGVDRATVGADVTKALETAALEGSAEEWPVVVQSLDTLVRGQVRPLAQATLLASVILLLAALANATFLLMAGGRAAVHEQAVRMSLGADRRRLLAPFLADGLWMGALATLGALVLAWVTLRTLTPRIPPGVPRLDLSTLDIRALGFAFLMGLTCVVVMAGCAALATRARSGPRVLAASARHEHGNGSAVRGGVASLQVALAVVSAFGAGLLLRTVQSMDRLDIGMAAEDITAVSLRVPYTWFDVPDHYFETLETVAEDVSGHPDVVAVRPSLGPPLQQRLEVVLVAEDQGPDAVEGNPYVAIDAVLPGHFGALGIPILSGRDLTSADNRVDAEPVVVVDRALADALWPGQTALGKRVSGFGQEREWYTVVGVASATRYREYLQAHPRAYFPMRRLGNSPPTALLVRAEPGAAPPIDAFVRAAFQSRDPDVTVLGAVPLREAVLAPTMGRRFASAVLGVFAVATLLLAFVGVYGVFTVSSQERVGEMGVRQALGAQAADIVLLVLRGTLRVAMIGAAAGLVLALWTGRLMESLLFGVGPLDTPTMMVVALSSLLVATLAGLGPALRAARVDPARSLRGE